MYRTYSCILLFNTLSMKTKHIYASKEFTISGAFINHTLIYVILLCAKKKKKKRIAGH